MIEPTTIQIARASAGEIIDLRHAVLRAGLPRETAIFAEDDEPTSRHFAARFNGLLDEPPDGVIVGCATLHLNMWDHQPAWQLRGMAITQEMQGMGVGSRLLAAIEQSVCDDSATSLLWCNARAPAVGFYAKHSWRVVSEAFNIPTAGPHVKMLRKL